jgi:tetratricopeptide (TPR) repeat protein
LKLNPHDAEAYMNRGLAKANGQQIDAAINDYKQAVQEKPGLADAFLYLGLAYQKRGDKEQAVTALEKAADLAKTPAVAVPAQASLKELRGTTPPQPSAVTAAVPKVFLQYRDRSDVPVLDAVTDSLKGERFNVQGKELRSEATQGDVRYYHPSDRQNAEAAKSSVEKALSAKGIPLKLQVLDLGPTYKSVAPGTIEVWLPSLSKPPAEVQRDVPSSFPRMKKMRKGKGAAPPAAP